jgi:hypothetical protein
VAALIKKDTGLDTELVEGGRGEFSVWVDGERVAQKEAGAFPADQDAVAAVRRALARG